MTASSPAAGDNTGQGRDWPEELLKARVMVWVCPIDEHAHPKELRATVKWRDGIAYCLTPGCANTSEVGS